MFVQQFFVKGLAHSSYILGGSETCAVVDPRRDISIYLQAAEDMGMKITHILETHLHADFISGHMDLARETGAQIVAPASAECNFEHMAVKEGDTFAIEDLAISVLDTPGHTPEHISYVVTDTARGPEPAGVFCGDTLFVGDVGRPDLFPGRAEELADKLYNSLHDKLLALPDFCEVYPAHGAGSLCGRAMGAKRTSTIGYERLYNQALLAANREEFIHSLTHDMPAAPDHFSRCSAINGSGPSVVEDLPPLEALNPAAFNSALQKDGTIILDVRPFEAFGGVHIPGAYHVDLGGNFATFAGWILPPDRDILLVAHTPEAAHEAAVWLRRVGLDRLVGYLEGGMFAWAKSGLDTYSLPQLSAAEFHRMTREEQGVVVLDVRSPGEFDAHHIEGAVNIPAPAVRSRYEELNPAAPTIVVCGTGHRSSMAVSLLLQRGFSRVFNVAGGMTGYSAMGFAPRCPLCVTPHGSKFLGVKEPKN